MTDALVSLAIMIAPVAAVVGALLLALHAFRRAPRDPGKARMGDWE